MLSSILRRRRSFITASSSRDKAPPSLWCDEGCVEGVCTLSDEMNSGSDVTAAVDVEGSQSMTAGDNESVEGVGCGDTCAGIVRFCNMANGIGDPPW